MQTKLWFIVESSTDVRLVEGLSRRFRLTVLTREISGRLGISRQPTEAVTIIRGPAGRVRFALAIAKGLHRHRRDVDAVVVQGYGVAALIANVIGRIDRLPTVMLVCSPTELYYTCRRAAAMPSAPYSSYVLAGMKLVARLNAILGQRYVVLSKHLGEVVRQYGRRLPVHIIPVYGVDMDRFVRGTEPQSEIRRRLGLPVDVPFLFFGSRIAPEKDPDTLIAALLKLVRRGQEVRVLHRSGGYLEFVRRAASGDVSSLIVATDAVHPEHELADAYRACDICVQVSRAEGLGFAVLEALSCDVPVVASSVGGLTETIIDGETGWTFRAGDPDDLAEKIQDVLANPIEAKRRTQRGRALVAERYETHAVLDRFAELVDSMASSRNGRSRALLVGRRVHV